jgi:thiol-disulfide isomerase/thioredoxin
MVNRQRNNRGRFAAHKPIDVRKESQIPALEAMIVAGPTTFILIHADWCGHCQHYKPTWNDFEKTPGRTANIASIHYDMMEKVPAIANAKIQGYPSVIKVEPNGNIEEYKVPGSQETTNALPEMRDVDTMKREMTAPLTPTGPMGPTGPKNNTRKNVRKNNTRKNVPKNNVRKNMRNNTRNNVRNNMPNTLRNKVPANIMAASNGMPESIPVSSIAVQPSLPEPPKDSGAPGFQAGILGQNDLLQKNVLAEQTSLQRGGQRGKQSGKQHGGMFESVAGAFIGAIQKAGPAALLLLAHSAVSSGKRVKTYKSPKRMSRRASTRKNRK